MSGADWRPLSVGVCRGSDKMADETATAMTLLTVADTSEN